VASRTLGAPQPANQGDPKRFFHGLFSKLPNSRAWLVGAFDCSSRTGWKTADRRGILAGWPVAFGRPNISTAPIAGWLTLRQRKRIQTSIPAVSTVKSAISRSMHGLALMISSVGRSIRRTRPSLGKRSESAPNALGTPTSSPNRSSRYCGRITALNRAPVGAYSWNVRAATNFRGTEKSRVWLGRRYFMARWRNGSSQGFHYRARRGPVDC
jgi:hypothetical protein